MVGGLPTRCAFVKVHLRKSVGGHAFQAVISLGFVALCGIGLRWDMEGAAEELLKYCMAGGKILKGLQKRRIDERAVFLS